VAPRTFQIAVGIRNSPEHLKNIAAVAAFIFIKRHSEAPDKIKDQVSILNRLARANARHRLLPQI